MTLDKKLKEVKGWACYDWPRRAIVAEHQVAAMSEVSPAQNAVSESLSDLYQAWATSGGLPSSSVLELLDELMIAYNILLD